ncbi:hypothetical protein HNR42_002336 [Deinobacterium chartae]|uniref:Uncharacterized protein n=1 Tax=Deinobacterium chartae TaxID=521158 RepID=A0A841HZE3_9DEIO|nr:hypothetical protein [Deinobacterium chartae]MBB6098901.1 hypothetical protein [Deinobacterium chartae]
MNFTRPLLGLAGLLIGGLIFTAVLSAPEAWQAPIMSAIFGTLAVATWFYARGERWIQVLALIIGLYAVIRLFL